jgi:hypothetical protein
VSLGVVVVVSAGVPNGLRLRRPADTSESNGVGGASASGGGVRVNRRTGGAGVENALELLLLMSALSPEKAAIGELFREPVGKWYELVVDDGELMSTLLLSSSAGGGADIAGC